ncbi:MAG: AAA-like domain-containing protein [Peptococcaceae bacterium]|nr:AAA-like domain-containing protein [Peptococcaceae bacterium]
MRKFNVTGVCVQSKNYMVDISNKIEKIKELVDDCSYFTINRARQYGKTTTLYALKRRLRHDYICLSLSFEGAGETMFTHAQSFCQRFLWQLDAATQNEYPHENIKWQNPEITDFDELSAHLTHLCANRKIVLMIDEVDRAGNHQIFLSFLGMLRHKYIERQGDLGATFHSVILAGVYDIKNIKLKMIHEGTHTPAATENKQYNSPWNIAVNFKVDMSFNPDEIATMLAEYENDHSTGMDITALSEEIYRHTRGYPFLVSRVCQCLDEELGKEWTYDGIQNAVNRLLDEKNTLFDDLCKNLENNKDLYHFIYNILIMGESYNFKFGNPVIELAHTFGIIENHNTVAVVSNRIFETLIYEYFISKEQTNKEKKAVKAVLSSDVVSDGKFNMQLCLEKFAAHYYELFSVKDVQFLERHGRLLFLSYLRPLINGAGFYHIESETRNQRRMDIVVDYNKEQFIVELKLWHGETYKESAYMQLLDYMAGKNTSTGYLLTFDFRRNQNKQPCAQWMEFNGRRIFDVVV